MKKILGAIFLSIFCGKLFAADMAGWNNYLKAYSNGHSECRKEWMEIGNFSSNPKIMLDIESCALEKDGAALIAHGYGSDFGAMIDIIDKKHAEVFEAAREASLDIIQFGNHEANLKRFLKKRQGILKRYHTIQKVLYFK